MPRGCAISIKATVPGDLITDLEVAGVVGDPLHELNFLNSSAWGDDYVWTFATTFVAPAGGAVARGSSLLVFDGVKMGSQVLLDGKPVGKTTDQFLRYVFPVTHAVAPPGSRHTLEVVLDPAIDCNGRWMACTGGWDWAPVSPSCIGNLCQKVFCVVAKLCRSHADRTELRVRLPELPGVRGQFEACLGQQQLLKLLAKRRDGV